MPRRTLSLLALLACAAVLSAQAAPPPVTAADLSALRFRTIGPANMSGRFVDLAVVERDPYTFYAASATGGIFRTTDNGITFTPVFEKEAVHSVGAIAVNQSNPDILWVGTGERANRQSSSWGDGVYKSIDAGRTWTHVGLLITLAAVCITLVTVTLAAVLVPVCRTWRMDPLAAIRQP